MHMYNLHEMPTPIFQGNNLHEMTKSIFREK